jgi:hypothetical protein
MKARTIESTKRMRSLKSSLDGLRFSGSLRSAPEQNAPPAPVTTTHLTSSLPAARRKTSRSSLNITKDIAFFFSGRLRVIVAT